MWSGAFESSPIGSWTSTPEVKSLSYQSTAVVALKTFVPSRWFALSVILTSLALLACAVALTQVRLRAELRDQLARREGTLFATVLRQQLRAEESSGDPLVTMLETSKLPELPGLRTLSLFDSRGKFTAAIPATAAETRLDPEILSLVQQEGLHSHLDLAADLAAESILPTQGRAPLLEVVLPMEDPVVGRAGFARLLLDGAGLAREFADLDITLRNQAIAVFAGIGTAMSLILGFAFHRIQSMNRRLRVANNELTLAAKTAAVGAVTSHLIHGLKNPLAGLQHFVSAQHGPVDEGWLDAVESTRRMRRMIDGVLHLLKENQFAGDPEVPLEEVLSSLYRNLLPVASKQQVILKWNQNTDPSLPGRDANLLSLVVENLVINAVQASPPGGQIHVTTEKGEGGFEVRVLDQGSGLPDAVRQNLFSPVTSTKSSGSGIGLALSRQIATSLGGTLELVQTGSSGTEFQLWVPNSTSKAGNKAS